MRVLRGEEEGVEIPNSDETYFRLLYSLNIYGKVRFTNLDVFKSSKVKVCWGKGGGEQVVSYTPRIFKF